MDFFSSCLKVGTDSSRGFIYERSSIYCYVIMIYPCLQPARQKNDLLHNTSNKSRQKCNLRYTCSCIDKIIFVSFYPSINPNLSARERKKDVRQIHPFQSVPFFHVEEREGKEINIPRTNRMQFSWVS